ncbi:hypothetical protein L226DRAFT_184290 [Lentinus tigrinus ALCF2SS1-7]|uniref:Uncharacterized protein n=1 Tax=Lentinus tigrinus ALCF2SS1-6 TaxID=1328759 RepID=A0A5C2SSA0_9APHY|nr:hypothetical protein L227DRAFT_126803 [Lentinus tigrinus ALCF2SS1-6]RPD79888.1 hypothetical protein L226DRAFT_184290 [Lentinus tigrinus ALCF2SS1-7]
MHRALSTAIHVVICLSRRVRTILYQDLIWRCCRTRAPQFSGYIRDAVGMWVLCGFERGWGGSTLRVCGHTVRTTRPQGGCG